MRYIFCKRITCFMTTMLLFFFSSAVYSDDFNDKYGNTFESINVILMTSLNINLFSKSDLYHSIDSYEDTLEAAGADVEKSTYEEFSSIMTVASLSLGAKVYHKSTGLGFGVNGGYFPIIGGELSWYDSFGLVQNFFTIDFYSFYLTGSLYYRLFVRDDISFFIGAGGGYYWSFLGVSLSLDPGRKVYKQVNPGFVGELGLEYNNEEFFLSGGVKAQYVKMDKFSMGSDPFDNYTGPADFSVSLSGMIFFFSGGIYL